MAHISELALFDYVAGKADLTTEETEHMQDCDDCRDEVISLRHVIEDSADIDKARHFWPNKESYRWRQSLQRKFMRRSANWMKRQARKHRDDQGRTYAKTGFIENS